MAIQSSPNTIIDASGDPALAQNEITLATANGGIFVYQTTKDIYVTEVSQTITNQSIKNIVNDPAGNVDGEIQFRSGGKFGADSDFRYDTITDTLALSGGLSTSLLTVSRRSNLGPVSNVTITGGNANEVLITDGSGSLSWGVPTSTYGDSNVAAFLPTYSGNISSFAVTTQVLNVPGLATLSTANVTGNITAGNARLGNLATANFFSGDGSLLTNLTGANVTGQVGNALVAGTVYTAAQPNITSVGILTGLSATGNIGTTGNISAAGNITGGNISTAGNITGGNLTVTGNVQADTAFVSDALVTRTGPLSLTATGMQNITLTTGTGNIALGTQTWITNLKDPVNVQDAATKFYVDAVAQGLKPKAAVNCATPNDISFAPAPAVIDGYTLVTGDRVLVKAQTNSAQNGIYTFDGTNLVRSTDADSASELPDGTFAFVESGSTFAACGFVLTSVVTVLGVSPVVFTQFAQAATYTAGSGLVLTGTQFSIATTTVTPASYGNATHVPSFVVSDTGQLTAASTNQVIANASTLAGTTLNPTVVTSSLTGVGTLNTLTVSGNANVGNIGAAAGVFTTVAGSLTTAAQPNITSLGTLTSLGVTGAVIAGSFAGEAGNLSNIQGANVTGTIAFAAVANSVAGANVSGQVANALVASTVYTAAQPNITSVGTLTSLGVTGDVTAASFIGAGNALSNIQGANVSGAVAFATTANSVAGANVSGQVANALVASTVYTAAQPNITSVGTLTGLTSGGTVDLTSASNVSLGPVANVKITGGTTGQVLSTNGSGTLQWTTPAAGIQSAYSATAPTVPTPVTGDLWYDTTNSQSKVYDGANWVSTGSSIAAGITSTAAGNLTATTVQAAINELDTKKLAIAGGTMTGSLILSGDPTVALGAATKQMVDAKVTGPASSTDNAVARYDSTTGKIVQNSGVTIDDANNINGVVNLTFSGLATGDGGALSNVPGSGVVGQVGNALVSGTVYTAAQPNITSVGTLTGLTIGGTTNLGPVANVIIAGGTSGQVLRTDGSGVLSWTTIGTSGISNGTSGVSVPAINGNVNTSVGGVANVLVVTSTGANVTGTLNATGDAVIGGTLNVTGAITGNITNANTANFAGVVTTAAQPNITSVGTLTSLDVTGAVTAARFTGAHSGEAGNLSNIQGANVSGNVTSAITANFANFAGNVTVAAQPNITSVGTLTGLTSGGVVDLTTASNVSLGAVGNVKITGGTSGQVLSTNGAGVLSWATPAAGGSSGVVKVVKAASTVDLGSLPGQQVFSIDGVSLSGGDRVLLKNQGSQDQNGIYLSQAGTFWLYRAPDADDIDELQEGTVVYVEEGTTNGGKSFIQTNTLTQPVGNQNIVFYPFAGSGSYTAKMNGGLSLVGSEFEINTSSASPDTFLKYISGGFVWTTPDTPTQTTQEIYASAGVIKLGQAINMNPSERLFINTNGFFDSTLTIDMGDLMFPLSATRTIAVTFVLTSPFTVVTSITWTNTGGAGTVTWENGTPSSLVNGASLMIDFISPDGGITWRANVCDVPLVGGTNGQVLSTNGSGGLSWITVGGGGASLPLANGTSNVNIATSGGNITFGVGGNANVLVLSGAMANITGKLTAGNVATPALITGAGDYITAGSGTVNNYLQAAIYNDSNTANASADFIAYNNNGSIVDIGVASNVFAQTTFSITRPSEAYLFASTPTGSATSGNLVIATDINGTNNSIEFYVGGLNQTKNGAGRKLLITSAGVDLGSNANVRITGDAAVGTNPQFLRTDGQGNLQWSEVDKITSYTYDSNIEIGVNPGEPLQGAATFNINGFQPLFVGRDIMVVNSVIDINGIMYARGQASFDKAQSSLLVFADLPSSGQITLDGTSSNYFVVGTDPSDIILDFANWFGGLAPAINEVYSCTIELDNQTLPINWLIQWPYGTTSPIYWQNGAAPTITSKMLVMFVCAGANIYGSSISLI